MVKALIKKDKKQLELFKSAKHREIEGVAMGVLEDGTPYLTERGLARLCGIHHSIMQRLSSDWKVEMQRPRGEQISKLLEAQGYYGDELFVEVDEDGQHIHAYTDHVCMAILEYYAFDSQQGLNKIALNNYRLLARQTLRTFIYTKVGYDPYNKIPESWKHYHDRVTLNDLPSGYFSVFREIADIIIYGIQQGLILNTHTVPDISVGKFWSQYWQDNNFNSQYGNRMKFPHIYPDYFPQAEFNPYDVWIYPLNALGNFRMWMQEEYLPEHFPEYLQRKVKQGLLPISSVELLLEAVEQKPKKLLN